MPTRVIEIKHVMVDAVVEHEDGSPPMLLDAAGNEIRQWMHATEQVPQAMPTPGTIVHVCQRAMTALPVMGGKGMLDWTTPSLPSLPPVRISIVDGNNPHEVFPLDGEYP